MNCGNAKRAARQGTCSFLQTLGKAPVLRQQQDDSFVLLLSYVLLRLTQSRKACLQKDAGTLPGGTPSHCLNCTKNLYKTSKQFVEK